MKSVENILGYIREQFYRFLRGCKPRENFEIVQENTLKCSKPIHWKIVRLHVKKLQNATNNIEHIMA